MRKLLLASAAAWAEPRVARSWRRLPSVNAAVPLPPTWTEARDPTAPGGIAGANTNLSAQGYYTKGPLPAPTPGSIVVSSTAASCSMASRELLQYKRHHLCGRKSNASRRPSPTAPGYAQLPGRRRHHDRGPALRRLGRNPGERGHRQRVDDERRRPGATAAQTLYIRRAFAYIGGATGGRSISARTTAPGWSKAA